MEEPAARFSLTHRQREVLALLVRGHTNSEIAERLGISQAGVKWHVSELLGKYGVESREQLADAWQRERSRSRGLRSAVGGPLALKIAAAAAGLALDRDCAHCFRAPRPAGRGVAPRIQLRQLFARR